MEKQIQKRIDLLRGSIPATLTQLALPLMGTSLIQMAYNLTDMAWIGRMGAGPVAAVGVAGTYMWLASGLTMLARVGGQVRVGQHMGAGNVEKAADYAQAALQMSIVLAAAFGAVLILFPAPLIAFFGLSGAQTILDAQIYLRIVGGGFVFNSFVMVLSALITTTGNSRAPFLATSVGLVINMILDPILIFGLWGAPKLGVAGAGIATVGAQVVVAALLLIYMLRDTHLLARVQLFRLPKASCVRDILKLSTPAALQSVLLPAVSMLLSRIVAGFGDNAIAVQRVGSQIESISWMIAEGFSAAASSFVAQNYGAGNVRRAKRGYFTSLGIVSIWGCISTAVLIFGAGPLFQLFIPQADILQMGVDYLVILGISQVFMCQEIVTAGAFNGFGHTVPPAVIGAILTVSRIPAAMALSSTALGLNGVWWSVSLSSVLKGIIMLAAFVILCRRMPNEKR